MNVALPTNQTLDEIRTCDRAICLLQTKRENTEAPSDQAAIDCVMRDLRRLAARLLREAER